MAIIKACNTVNTPKNTGKECDTAMVATAMLIAIKKTVTFNDTDLLDPVTWLTARIQAKEAFPLFGLNAPIRTITNDSEGDQIITLDDGLKVFLRYGLYNRTFETTSGGLCYAAALQSFLNSGYSILEVDQQGQLLARKNSDGTYSGLITDFMYAPSPIMADFKSTPWKSKFSYSFSPIELVTNGIIFTGASGFLSMMGLIDTKFGQAAAATIAQLNVSLTTECADDDLVAKFTTDLNHPAMYLVVDLAAPTVPITISGVTNVSGYLRLAGTFTSGHIYRVTGTAPSVWAAQTPVVDGYDGTTSYVDITIP